MTATREVTAAAIRDAIRAQNPGVAIRCDQTGGGTATIYLGEVDRDGRYCVAIGPGSYDWSDPWASVFDLGDTAVGPDDMGEVRPDYPATLAGIAAAASLSAEATA